MNKIMFFIIAVFVVGCAAPQPSTYTNYNTPQGNKIEATGAAAAAAANANKTNNNFQKSSSEMSNKQIMENYFNNFSGSRNRSSYSSNPLARVVDASTRTVERETINLFNNEIREAFTNLF